MASDFPSSSFPSKRVLERVPAPGAEVDASSESAGEEQEEEEVVVQHDDNCCKNHKNAAGASGASGLPSLGATALFTSRSVRNLAVSALEAQMAEEGGDSLTAHRRKLSSPSTPPSLQATPRTMTMTTTDTIGGGQEASIEAQAPILNAFLQQVVKASSDGVASAVDDSFSCCFESQPYEPWNWNFYLFPLWCVGFVVRYVFLFPVRLVSLILGMLLCLILWSIADVVITNNTKRKEVESRLLVCMCNVFVWSWTGVVQFHGPQPSRGAKVFVANHTSMIDFMILESKFPFAVIAQKYNRGWEGWLQSRVLDAVGCIKFDRNDSSDRAAVAKRIQDHVHEHGSNPLLIFPEGTCVNNEHCVMFKRSAFDLDVPVCPIAIKYNKTFVDAFWNSKRESFTMHLYKLMTSWAVVADVWFLEPMEKLPGESSIDFAARVQKVIAERASLRVVPWDGMYKYIAPKPETRERRRRAFAELMKSSLKKKK